MKKRVVNLGYIEKEILGYIEKIGKGLILGDNSYIEKIIQQKNYISISLYSLYSIFSSKNEIEPQFESLSKKYVGFFNEKEYLNRFQISFEQMEQEGPVNWLKKETERGNLPNAKYLIFFYTFFKSNFLINNALSGDIKGHNRLIGEEDYEITESKIENRDFIFPELANILEKSKSAEIFIVLKSGNTTDLIKRYIDSITLGFKHLSYKEVTISDEISFFPEIREDRINIIITTEEFNKKYNHIFKIRNNINILEIKKFLA